MLLTIALQIADLLDRLLPLCGGHAFVRPVTRDWQTIRTIALTLALCQLEGESLQGKCHFPPSLVDFIGEDLHWDSPCSL